MSKHPSVVLTSHCKSRLHERFGILPIEMEEMTNTTVFSPVGYQSGNDKVMMSGHFMGMTIILAGNVSGDTFVAHTALEQEQAIANMQMKNSSRIGMFRDMATSSHTAKTVSKEIDKESRKKAHEVRQKAEQEAAKVRRAERAKEKSETQKAPKEMTDDYAAWLDSVHNAWNKK